jgi:TRAP-type C4-dicarboxylate transport system permease small subunit
MKVDSTRRCRNAGYSMNRIRFASCAIFFASITYIDWLGDKISYSSGRYGADKFPSGWGYYLIPAAFFLGGLSVIVLLIDAVIISAKWIKRRITRTEAENKDSEGRS